MPAPFDRFASDYMELINRGARITGENYDYFARLRLGLMREALGDFALPNAGLRMLDFGCGIGATEPHMREFFPGARITGVDPSAECIEAARRRGLDGVSFLVLGSERLPFESASFDLAYSNGTFHHLPAGRRRVICRELLRALAPGGRLFVFENNPLNPLMRRAMKNSPLDRGAEWIYPLAMKRLLAESGFLPENIQYYAFFPAALKFLRAAERRLRRLPLGAQYLAEAIKPG